MCTALPTNTCRDSWLNNLTEADFSNYTCAKCFVQVLLDKKSLRMDRPPAPPFWLHHKTLQNVSFPADPGITPSPVCGAADLSEAECNKWRHCCFAAQRCCTMMLRDETDREPRIFTFLCLVQKDIKRVIGFLLPNLLADMLSACRN